MEKKYNWRENKRGKEKDDDPPSSKISTRTR
jgi:hypothetical protein